MSENETTSDLLHASGISSIGDIPEPRPPSPSELAQVPHYPHAAEWQARHHVNRVFDEVMRERAEQEAKEKSMSDEQELATGGVIEDAPIMEREQGEELVMPPPGSQVYPNAESGIKVNYTIHDWNAIPNPKPTLLSPAGIASTYVGTWRPTPLASIPTEADIRAMVAKWLREDSAIRALLSEVVDERLDKLADELRENGALRPSSMARGVYENENHSHARDDTCEQ